MPFPPKPGAAPLNGLKQATPPPGGGAPPPPGPPGPPGGGAPGGNPLVEVIKQVMVLLASPSPSSVPQAIDMLKQLLQAVGGTANANAGVAPPPGPPGAPPRPPA